MEAFCKEYGFVWAQCLQAIECGNELYAERAVVIAAFLEQQSPERIVLYGCGKASRVLVERYQRQLQRHDVRFMVSCREDAKPFHGYMVDTPENLRQTPPDKVLILSRSHQKTMLEQVYFLSRENVYTLSEMMATIDMVPHVNGLLERISAHLALDLEEIRRICQAGKTLCFTAFGLSQHFLKTIAEVKNQGYGVVLITGNNRINDAMTLDPFGGGAYFDYLYVSRYGYGLELLQIVKNCPFEAMHAVATMASTLPLAAVIEEKRCPIVVEYCDFKQIVFDNDAVARQQFGLTEAAYEIEKSAQSAVYCGAEGLVYKDDPAIIDFLNRQYGHQAEALHFMPYISRTVAEVVRKPVPHRDASQSIRIVYAGCLHNNPNWHPYAHHVSTLDVAQMLTAQGFYFSIYNAMDSTGKGFEPYLDLARENDLFDYHFAVAYDELPAILSTFDFGIHCFDITHAVEGRFFLRTTLASKVFTYLEAGLPVLMMTETEFMYRLVNELGIGIGVRFNTLSTLRLLLETTDWEPIRRHIDQARREMTLLRHIPRLLAFYRKAAERYKAKRLQLSAVTCGRTRPGAG